MPYVTRTIMDSDITKYYERHPLVLGNSSDQKTQPTKKVGGGGGYRSWSINIRIWSSIRIFRVG